MREYLKAAEQYEITGNQEIIQDYRCSQLGYDIGTRTLETMQYQTLNAKYNFTKTTVFTA